MAYNATEPFAPGDSTTVERLNRGFNNAKALLDGDAGITGGAWFTIAHSAAHYTASGSMTWTVDAGDQTYRRWKIVNGKTLLYRGKIVASDVGGTASTQLRIALPAGLTVGAQDAEGVVFYKDAAGARTIGRAIAVAGATYVAFEKLDGANWTLTTSDDTEIIFNITLELA
jgi:hypothetical protein